VIRRSNKRTNQRFSPKSSTSALVSAFFSVLVLAGCATAPLSTDQVSTKLTPEEVQSDPAAAKGTVIWGGVIVSSTNLADRTQFEVLAYPLDNYQRPATTEKSLGRFLLQSPEYIETQNYSPGRELTAIGTLQGVTKGEIGEATYEYPTVTLSDVHLWHSDNAHEEPRFIFGIGINVGG